MKIKENLYLFLISLFISLIIWYGLKYSSLSKVERWEKSVPIKIETPQNLILKNLSPDQLRVFGEGYNPEEYEISVVIPIDKIKEGHYKINITKEILKIPEESKIKKIEPQQVDIELERKILKEVPFILPEEISNRYKIKIEPKNAKVSGAQSDLRNLNEFKIPQFQIPPNIPSNILLPLSSPSKEIELISPLTIEIKIEGLKK